MTIERVVLHIGETKTGSSALQRALWLHEDWLAERGVHVLRSERSGLLAQHEQFRLSDYRKDSLAEVRLLDADTTCWTVVVSSESFVHVGERTGLIARRLAETFGQTPIDAIVYVRNPLDWVQSSAVHAYQGMNISARCLLGLNRPISEIRDAHFSELQSHLVPVANFHGRLGPIAARLGCRSLTFRAYHRPSMPDCTIFGDFLQALDIEEEPDHVDGAVSVNPSLPLEAIVAVHRLGGFDVDLLDPTGPIPPAIDLAADLGGQLAFLLPSTHAIVGLSMRDDLDQLLRANPHLDAIQYPLRPPASLPDEDLVARYIEGLQDIRRYPILPGTGQLAASKARDVDGDGRLVVRISPQVRLTFADRFRVRVSYGNGECERVDPCRLDRLGALYQIPVTRPDAVELAYEGIKP